VAGARLAAARADLLAQVDELTRQFDDIVAASESSNSDDEHDPEGATIAFERAQVSALLDALQVRLREVEQAVARLERGEYGVCQSCGRPIEAERLEARPSAATCTACAAQAGTSRR
jgi:RNA polymerase-binding transcription factor DksA